MDETYIKVKGQWVYLYRAVDKEGKTVDFMLSEKRDEPAARTFFEKAIGSNGLPEKATMDKSGANKAGIDPINLQLALLFMMGGLFIQLTVRQIKYLNNIVEQDHRFIKKITKPTKGFKAFYSADTTLSRIELHHMLRKGQHKKSDNQTIYRKIAIVGMVGFGVASTIAGSYFMTNSILLFYAANLIGTPWGWAIVALFVAIELGYYYAMGATGVVNLINKDCKNVNKLHREFSIFQNEQNSDHLRQIKYLNYRFGPKIQKEVATQTDEDSLLTQIVV